MEHLKEEAYERHEARETVTAKDLLIKLRKDHMNSISLTLQSLRAEKYKTKSIDIMIALQSQIALLTDEYLQVESKLNQLIADE